MVAVVHTMFRMNGEVVGIVSLETQIITNILEWSQHSRCSKVFQEGCRVAFKAQRHSGVKPGLSPFVSTSDRLFNRGLFIGLRHEVRKL